MTFEIWFQDDGKDLFLEQTLLRGGSVPVKMVSMGGLSPGDDQSMVVRWTDGARALTFFLLRAFQSPDPLAFVLEGGDGTQAASLHSALKDKYARNTASTTTWIIKMFIGPESPERSGANTSPQQTSDPSLAKNHHPLYEVFFTWDRSERPKNYVVKLASPWKGSTFIVHLNSYRAPKQIYSIIADAVDSKKSLTEYFRTHPLDLVLVLQRSTLAGNRESSLTTKISDFARKLRVQPHVLKLGENSEREAKIALRLPAGHLYDIFMDVLAGRIKSPDGDFVTFGSDVGEGTWICIIKISSVLTPEEHKKQCFRELVDKIRAALHEYITAVGASGTKLEKVLKGITEIIRLIMREKSTILLLELSPGKSEEFVQALLAGSVHLPEGVEVEMVPQSIQRTTRVEYNPQLLFNGAESSADTIIQSLCRKAYFEESIRRPWRRLLSLLSGEPEKSASASVLRASAKRSYSAPQIREFLPSLIVDLKIGLLIWPFLGALLAFISCLIVQSCGYRTDIPLGIATGLALAMTGAQACSFIVSPLACHAGLIFVGWAFGFSQAILLGNQFISQQLTSELFLSDPFKTITGGLLGITAFVWRAQLSWPMITTLLIATAIGIGMSGWLMGQPKRAESATLEKGRLPDWAGAALGFLAGIGIPCVRGFSSLLVAVHFAPIHAFCCAFALLGSLAMGGLVRWRTKNTQRAIAFGVLHGIVGFCLCEAAFTFAGKPFALLIFSAATAYYHATWFTCAFVIGQAVSSVRGAVWATWAEGIPFYLLFLITELLHKPIF